MLLIGNGRLITRDDGAFFDDGAVVIEGNLIQEVGTTAAMRQKYPHAEFLDARGGTIMPGLINAHNHIYSAFARGLSIDGYSPKNFNDILEGMWWKIDRQLTLENDHLSACAIYLDCIKNGVTTVFDHHASYHEIPGSLDMIARPAVEYGVRTCLCYEVSDRDGEAKMREAVLENERFIQRAASDETDMLKGMMGLHAAFTLSDETLAFCAEHQGREAGYHIHVAEGPGDLQDSLKRFSKRIVHRLFDAGILGPKTLAIHCVHVNRAEIELLKATDTMVVHNPESNMGNAVGSANIRAMIEEGILVGLGTDGYICDMIQSYRLGNALCKHSSGDPGAGWGELPQMLFINNARIAERCFPVKLGMIKEGYAADIIVMDYMPPTEISEKNINGHLLFGSSGRNVVTTIANGKVLMKDRKLTELDRERIFAKARECSKEVWKRL